VEEGVVPTFGGRVYIAAIQLHLFQLNAQDVPLLEVVHYDIQFFSRTFGEEEAEAVKS
jgi:hypothetical protein